jgi:hypothetical protein
MFIIINIKQIGKSILRGRHKRSYNELENKVLQQSAPSAGAEATLAEGCIVWNETETLRMRYSILRKILWFSGEKHTCVKRNRRQHNNRLLFDRRP